MKLSPLFYWNRGGQIRTDDILLPKQARYQAALHPEHHHYSRRGRIYRA